MNTTATAMAHRLAWDGTPYRDSPLGHGHIHDTFLVEVDGAPDLVLQRFNAEVFPDVGRVMENIARVSTHLKAKAASRGEDPHRAALSLVETPDGAPFLTDDDGHTWRAFVHIHGSVAYDEASPKVLGRAAAAFGQFQADLSDLDGEPLHITLEGFHDTPERYQALLRAAESDVADRAREVALELERFAAAAGELDRIVRPLEEGKLPSRACHYDTKLNNVLFCAATEEPLCVIDLDTVMPGSPLYDFGDAVRAAAGSAPEDGGTEGVPMELDEARFKAMAKGYLSTAAGFLTGAERAGLADACRIVALELASRFLTDHLSGDRYFAPQRPGHNLARTRAQLDLADAFLRRKDWMLEVLEHAYIQALP